MKYLILSALFAALSVASGCVAIIASDGVDIVQQTSLVSDLPVQQPESEE